MNDPQQTSSGAPEVADQAEDMKRRRRQLLLLLLVLLFVPLCLWIVAQIALLGLGSDEAEANLLSELQATYMPWAPANFGPLDPTLIGTIRAEQATFAANTGGIGILVPFIPGSDGLTKIAGFTTRTPTANPTATRTATPLRTNTPVIIYYPGTVTATAPGAPTPGGPTSTPDTPIPPIDTLVPGAMDLSISKSNGVAVYAPGGTTIYTIVASNAGPQNANNARVRDFFPPEITSATWTCTASPGSSCPASGNGDINTTVDLLVGGSATFTVSANISGAATGALVNTAQVLLPPGKVDPNPGNNSATDSDTQLYVDLAVTKTDGLTAITRGHNVTYNIVVTNNGTTTATGASVADTLPAGLGLPITWSCSGTGGTVFTCPGSGSATLADTVTIPASGSITYAVTARASVTGTGTTLNNSATATFAGDLDTSDNTGTDNNTQITDVVVTLGWGSLTTRADFDLWIVDPSGIIHSANNTASPPNSPSGGTLSVDRNCSGGMFGSAIPAAPYGVSEAASWTASPPAAPYPTSGTYRVYVYYNETCGAGTGTVSWSLSVDINGVTTTVATNSYTGNFPGVASNCPGLLLMGDGTTFAPGCPPTPYDPSSEVPVTYQFTVP